MLQLMTSQKSPEGLVYNCGDCTYIYQPSAFSYCGERVMFLHTAVLLLQSSANSISSDAHDFSCSSTIL